MQGGEPLVIPPRCSADSEPACDALDLSGRRAEVEGGEERPEIFPLERRQGGGCCGFPNAKSEEGSRTPVEEQTHMHPRRPRLVIAMRCLLYEIWGVAT